MSHYLFCLGRITKAKNDTCCQSLDSQKDYGLIVPVWVLLVKQLCIYDTVILLEFMLCLLATAYFLFHSAQDQHSA